MVIAELPFIDEHVIELSMTPDVVWPAISRALDGSSSGWAATAYSRAVGCADYSASGPRPFEVGSTIPGFRVTKATACSELVLEGSHRFSVYSLTFRVESLGSGRTRVVAETRAKFPGVLGGIYKGLVIKSGGHRVGMRRLLSAVKRACG